MVQPTIIHVYMFLLVLSFFEKRPLCAIFSAVVANGGLQVPDKLPSSPKGKKGKEFF